MSATEYQSVQELARVAAGSFEVATREDGTDYTRRRSDAPEWVQELVFEAHADMLPEDWRYACIAAACEAIADADDPDDAGSEFADAYVDVYTSNLLGWLASNLQRQFYVDEAAEEFGGDVGDISQRIALGQYAEALEVYGLVLAFLQRCLSPARIES